MAGDPRYTPKGVKAPHGAHVMEITWGDGHVSKLPHEVLRGFCPCATCQGHGGNIRYVAGGNLEIRELAETGSYALTFVWGDQHQAGIYTFRYLRSLCQCAACAPSSPFVVPAAKESD